MARRRLAVVLALAACAISLAFAWSTYRCGVQSVSEPCVDTADCGARASCVSALHPLALPFALGGAIAAALAWRGLGTFAIVLGVVALVLGLLAGFSMGLVGIGSGALILVAGLLTRGDRMSSRAAEP